MSDYCSNGLQLRDVLEGHCLECGDTEHDVGGELMEIPPPKGAIVIP